MRVIWLFGMLAALMGCSSHYADDARNRKMLEAMREGKSYFPTSSLVAYQIPHGVQRDDSYDISSDNLNYIKGMVSCPKVSINENPYSYQVRARIDREDMTVKVDVNRGRCEINQVAVKNYLDGAILVNRSRRLELYERERRQREVDPKGPYKLGCEAYQNHVRGVSDVTTVDTAVKLYPKLNAAYVKRLFTTGWGDASLYGVRGIDCEYLSLGVHG